MKTLVALAPVLGAISRPEIVTDFWICYQRDMLHLSLFPLPTTPIPS